LRTIISCGNAKCTDDELAKAVLKLIIIIMVLIEATLAAMLFGPGLFLKLGG